MPPEIGLLALVLAVPAFILALRTRLEVRGRRPGHRFGPLSLRDAPGEADPALEGLARTLERMEASQRDLARRLENLETIVTTESGRTGVPQIAIPPPEPTAAQEAERLARQLRDRA